MALQGTLETFTVPDVLRLLATTKKTGLFALEGDRGTGRVWLDEGGIAGATSDREHGGDIDAVLFDLLRFTTGSFRFEPDEVAPESSSAEAESVGVVEEVLERAEQLLVEWREIESIIPSLDAWVRLLPDLDGESVTIGAALWQVLAVLGGGSTGRRVGADLDLGELDACRRLRDLVDLGVAEVDMEFVSAEERMGLSILAPLPMDPPPPPPPPATHAGVEEEPRPSTNDDEPALVDHHLSNAEVATLGMDLASFVARPSEPQETYEVGVYVDDEHDAETSTNGWAFESSDDDHGVTFDSSDDAVVEMHGAYAVDPVDAPDAADDSDEFLSQLANLSPKAAAAIEATNGFDHGAEPPVVSETVGLEAADDGAEPSDEELNKNLLLKFLSSAQN